MKKCMMMFAVGALALASCSHDEYTGPDYEGGKLIVNGGINEVTTRANNAVWDEGDAIGISSSAGHDNVRHTTTGDGSFTGTTPIYVLGAGETTFTAYYPHNEAVNADVPEITFSEPEDYMWASTKATRENPRADFQFTHKMSKLSIDISDSSGASPVESTAMISGLSVSGKFNTLTGEVTPDATKGNITKEFSVPATVEYIVPAQSLNGEVSVIIQYNGKTYGGVLPVNQLAESTQYNFTIDMNGQDPASRLTISSATISDWTQSEGGNIDMEEQEMPNTLEVGDYLLSNGKIIDFNDSKFDELKSQIVGVVYYVGNAQPSALYGVSDSQDALKKDYPAAANGLAIAINDGNGGTPARFVSAKYSFADWMKAETNTQAANFLADNLNVTSTDKLTKMLGYNNTEIIKAATNDVGAETTGATELLGYLSDFNAANKVDGASSWYVPSYAELMQLVANYTKVKAAVEKAGGKLDTYPGFIETVNENFYWTSDMRGKDYNWVSPLCDAEGVNLFQGKSSSGTKGYFRFSIAF